MTGRVITDTTQFHTIDRGDAIRIGGRLYDVTGHAREGRFGIDDDPKLWVKRATDRATGERKIVKLSFLESFETTLGGVRFTRFRNPEKEGAILDLVRDHPLFMHGQAHHDDMGNNIRVIDYVPGPSFYRYIEKFDDVDHEQYFHEELPRILAKLVEAFNAIRYLHANGFKHGDIRNDHIIIDRNTGNYVWIDFDYDYTSKEAPWAIDLYGIGNILAYAVGKGFHDLADIRSDTATYGDLGDRIDEGDISLLEGWRFFNLAKIHPHIPMTLNNIVMHFSRGAEVYYEHVNELLEDLVDYQRYSLF